MLHHYAFKKVGQDAAVDRFKRSVKLQRLADPTTVHQPTGKQHFGNDRQSARAQPILSEPRDHVIQNGV